MIQTLNLKLTITATVVAITVRREDDITGDNLCDHSFCGLVDFVLVLSSGGDMGIKLAIVCALTLPVFTVICYDDYWRTDSDKINAKLNRSHRQAEYLKHYIDIVERRK